MKVRLGIYPWSSNEEGTTDPCRDFRSTTGSAGAPTSEVRHQKMPFTQSSQGDKTAEWKDRLVLPGVGGGGDKHTSAWGEHKGVRERPEICAPETTAQSCTHRSSRPCRPGQRERGPRPVRGAAPAGLVSGFRSHPWGSGGKGAIDTMFATACASSFSIKNRKTTHLG